MAERIQLSRAKGWRLPAGAVKVDRSTRWGNPFRTHGDGVRMDQGLAVQLFRAMLEQHGGYQVARAGGIIDNSLAEIRQQLRGKNLACWCKPGTPCHADVLLEIANAPTPAAGTPPPDAQRSDPCIGCNCWGACRALGCAKKSGELKRAACRWPDCGCHAPQGPGACRRTAGVRVPDGSQKP